MVRMTKQNVMVSISFSFISIYLIYFLLCFEGYFDEMHKFEYFDMYLPKYGNTPAKLRHQFNLRHERIKNCSHDWPLDEMKRIMVPLNEMKEDWSVPLRSVQSQ